MSNYSIADHAQEFYKTNLNTHIKYRTLLNPAVSHHLVPGLQTWKCKNTLLKIVLVIWKNPMKKESQFYFKVQPDITDTLYVLYGEINWPEFCVQCKSSRRHFGDSYSVCMTVTKNWIVDTYCTYYAGINLEFATMEQRTSTMYVIVHTVCIPTLKRSHILHLATKNTTQMCFNHQKNFWTNNCLNNN